MLVSTFIPEKTEIFRKAFCTSLNASHFLWSMDYASQFLWNIIASLGKVNSWSVLPKEQFLIQNENMVAFEIKWVIPSETNDFVPESFLRSIFTHKLFPKKLFFVIKFEIKQVIPDYSKNRLQWCEWRFCHKFCHQHHHRTNLTAQSAESNEIRLFILSINQSIRWLNMGQRQTPLQVQR